MGGVLSGIAVATHEAHHRFTVFGYVRDDHGIPTANVRVIIVDKRLDRANTTFSDGEGYYEGMIHIHNEDLGDEITVMAGDQQKTIRAEFDPEDTSSERRVQVDFGAPPSASSAEQSDPRLIYGVAALVVLSIVVAIGASRFRKKNQKKVQKRSKQKK